MADYYAPLDLFYLLVEVIFGNVLFAIFGMGVFFFVFLFLSKASRLTLVTYMTYYFFVMLVMYLSAFAAFSVFILIASYFITQMLRNMLGK